MITGGGGGIGPALAEYWVANGGQVLLADVSDSLLASAAARLQDMNGDVGTMEFFRRGLADGIRCVAVAPGYVGTAMV